jgi:hypothetical protein
MFQPEFPMRTPELHATLGESRHQELLREARHIPARALRPGVGARIAPLLVRTGEAVAALGRRLQASAEASAAERAMRGRAVHG